MPRLDKFLLLTWMTLFLTISITLAGNVGIFMLRWSFPIPITPITPVAPHALDSIGQAVYFGSSVTTGYTNYLFARNISSGNEIWRYNTSLPVNYVTHFRNNSIDYVAIGTGGSTTQPSKSYVITRATSGNATFWQSINLVSSVKSLGSAKSYLTTGEDVIAGLENGTVLRLRGDNGAVLWRYPTTGSVFSVAELKNGSIIVGTREIPNRGYVYLLNSGGSLRWGPIFQNNILTLVKKFGDVNADDEPDVIVVFNDNRIHVLNGLSGSEIAPWPFILGSDNIKDLLCTEDYTGDGFPDVVGGTEYGNLTIVNGRNATRFRGPTPIGYTISYIQYMHLYENGIAYSNKTLAVSLLELGPLYYIRGVNATNLAVMKEYQTNAPAWNLFNTSNFTRNFVGDLIFTANNVVYNISGDEIIVPEFSSPIFLVTLIIAMWFLIVGLRRGRLRVQ